jgi:hypothetical protein
MGRETQTTARRPRIYDSGRGMSTPDAMDAQALKVTV